MAMGTLGTLDIKDRGTVGPRVRRHLSKASPGNNPGTLVTPVPRTQEPENPGTPDPENPGTLGRGQAKVLINRFTDHLIHHLVIC